MIDIKTCIKCGSSLPKKNKTGKCRKCYKTDYEKAYCSNRYKVDKMFSDKQKQRVLSYNKEHKLERLAYNRQYRSTREQKDINFKLSNYLRSRLTHAVRGKNIGSAVRDLGCTIEELKAHLESKFLPGMSWDNYGRTGWHIDHIVPISSFDLTVLEELKKACHYTNLQPLWAKDNIIKRNNL
jgi:hypothetical protein